MCGGLALLTLSFARLNATPDREVIVTERLLGTSADGFAILRVEMDNLGSHYSSGEKHFLDIYEKNSREEGADFATKNSTVLLLDQTYSKHPDAKRNALPEVSLNEMADADEAVSLPHLIAKFPRMPEKWEVEKFQRLGAQPTGGVWLEHYNLIWGGWVKERFGVGRNDDLDWKLEDVMEDSNSLFLKVSIVEQTRWICILPKTTKQVRARLFLQEFYLVAGTFDTEEEAVALAKEINRIRRDRKFYGFDPEVWSERTPRDKTRYRVVSGLEESAVENDSFSKLEEIFGLEIEVSTGLRFENRIFIE